jgi:hypothetical protein
VLAAKRGACLSELIPNRISQIFGSKPHLSFLWAVLISLPFSCFVRRNALHPLLRAPRLSRRRSPLAGASGFAYASDIAEDNVCKPGHVVELSF